MASLVKFTGGMQAPAQAGRNGGFRLLSGDQYVIQLVMVLAGSQDCENPFWPVGLGARAIFANLSDDAWRAQEERRIREIFRDLEKAQIAKLKSVDIVLGKPDSGQAQLIIRFLSIESATELGVETTLRRTA